MAGFSYGASPHFMGGDSFGQEDDVLQRSADGDEDLDDLVARNIRDVLQQVGDDTATYPAGYGADDPDGLGGPAGGGDEGAGPAGLLAADLTYASSAASGPAGTSGGTRQQQQSSLQQRLGGRRPSGGLSNPSQQQQQQQQQRASGIPSNIRAKRLSSTDSTAAEGAAGAARAGGSSAAARLSSGPLAASDSLVVGASAAPSAAAAAAAVGAAASAPLSLNLDVPGQPEASLRLHKARIRALEEDLGRANKALLDREKQLSEALRELKDLRGQAANWARDKKALEGQLDKARKQAVDAEALARTTESQVRELSKADSRAERERKATEAEVRARDVRLQRALEEVERYKQLLAEVRAQEREAKGSAQQDAGRLLADNRRLERQRGELITAFKKQLKLIEVLKRQKVHLEAARALQFSEEEFLKTLEMGAT